MQDGSKTPTQVLVEERTGRDIDDLLRELYVQKRHSQQDIADGLTLKMPAGVTISRASVSEWLRDRGIAREERPAVSL